MVEKTREGGQRWVMGDHQRELRAFERTWEQGNFHGVLGRKLSSLEWIFLRNEVTWNGLCAWVQGEHSLGLTLLV